MATLLEIENIHAESCGIPPFFSNQGRNCYIGYFESALGEQWLFTRSRLTGVAEVRGGDAGWDKSYLVVGGKAEGLVLTDDEAAWVAICWVASSRTIGS